MLRNYLKIAFRQLYRNKTFSFINIFGLSIGMAASLLLLLWIQNEVTYDNFHSKKDRIYSLWNKSMWSDKLTCWDVTPRVAAPTLREHFPEIDKVCRLDWTQTKWVKANNHLFLATGNAVDEEFLSIFDFPLLQGNAQSVFKNKNSVVITPELSKKLFNTENSIGKFIELENKERLTVTGIISPPPGNSMFKFEYLMPWKFIEGSKPENNWGNNSTKTIVLLKEKALIDPLQKKIKDLRKDYSKDSDVYDMFLYPMNRWRLHSNFENGVESGGRVEIVRLFSIIACLIILIACINFMNLSTARSEKRAKEVGVRKAIGADRFSLIKQFLGETLFISFISFLIAVIIVQVSLPAYNKLIVKNLSINYASPLFWLFALSFITVSGLLAGIYPAFFISSFNPVKVLKGTFVPIKSALTPRKVLVVTQFIFAIVLIISTIIIQQQINYVTQRDIGYNKENLVYHFLNEELDKNYVSLKNELLAQQVVESVTKSSSPITQGWSDSWGFEWEGKDPNDRTDFDRYFVDENVVKTTGIKLLQGRDFNLKEFATDSTAMIINESALKIMKFKNPIGQTVKDGDQPFHVIGVIKDFILNSPFDNTKPMLLMGAKGWFNVINLRLNNNATQDLGKIEKLFKKYNPDFPFDLKYVNTDHQEKFTDIQRSSKLATLFSILTIVISCLGLFGLASFMAENKIKEIGVRKVLGATVIQISTMLSANFIKLVFVAFIIASPIAWWLLNNWLKDYPYHVSINWWVFALAGVMALLIALATVSYQAIKAAVANPTKSLRTE